MLRTKRSSLALTLAFGLLAASVAGAFAQSAPSPTLSVRYSFGTGSGDGTSPQSPLLSNGDGTFTSTTNSGGPNSEGTIYTFDGTADSVKASFPNSGNFSAFPNGLLARVNDGSLYGTTSGLGGGGDNGSIFHYSSGSVSIGYLFSQYNTGGQTNSDGALPLGGVIADSSGNIYGTASRGGLSGTGTVYQLTGGGTFTVLHTFGTQTGDGNFPECPPVLATDGNLYGTTNTGGASGSGAVYRVGTDGSNYKVLHSFSGSEGSNPIAPLIQGSDGNFYGTTTNSPNGGKGTVFMMNIDGTVTVLYTFSAQQGEEGTNQDGASPQGALVRGVDGSLFGTTNQGGANNKGTAFKLTMDGTFSAVSFDGTAGANPQAGLLQIDGVRFYGTASGGGANGNGTIYQVVFPAKPVITSSLTATAKQGSGFSYKITASNEPTKYGAASLPSGLSINQTTGVISGTVSTAGTYKITIAAFNDSGSGSASLTLTVLAAPPVITSATTATATTGKAFSYQIKATNNPTKYGAANLPPGLSINQTTGLISGTPTKTGTYAVTIAAFSAGGSGSAKLTITVSLGTPVITSATSASATVGRSFTYQITATNSPTKYGASGLPSGLSIDQTSGKISGAPTTAGTYSVTIAAFNASGNSTAKVTITVKAASPVITSPTSASGTVGSAFSYQISASGNPTKYGASGLPSGLSINQTTGVISGTPTKAGTYTAIIAAFNAAGNGTAKLTITIK